VNSLRSADAVRYVCLAKGSELEEDGEGWEGVEVLNV